MTVPVNNPLAIGSRTRRFCTSNHHTGPRWLLAIEFHVKVWGDETKTWPAQLQSQCKSCQRISSRIYQGLAKRGVPYEARVIPSPLTEEERRERRVIKAKRYQNWINKPGNREDRKEYGRIYQEAKRREAGIEPRAKDEVQVFVTHGDTRLPAGPLLEYCEAMGIQSRHLVGLNNVNTVTLHRADVILQDAGHPYVLNLLYPLEA